MVRMNDCQFFVNKDKRAVTCIYYTPDDDIYSPVHVIEDNSNNNSFIVQWDDYKLQRRYVGVARCNPSDEWNEEYGKLVAFYYMKRNYFRDYFSKLNKFYDVAETQLEQYRTICDNIGAKFTKELDRLDDKIMENLGEKIEP